MWENIDKILKERKINVLQLSRGTNIPPTTIYTWKNGKTTPSADKLAKVAEFLNVSIDFLLGKTTEQSKPQEIQYDSDLSFVNELMKHFKSMDENKRKAMYTISADINDMDEMDIEFVKSFIKTYIENKRKQNK